MAPMSCCEDMVDTLKPLKHAINSGYPLSEYIECEVLGYRLKPSNAEVLRVMAEKRSIKMAMSNFNWAGGQSSPIRLQHKNS